MNIKLSVEEAQAFCAYHIGDKMPTCADGNVIVTIEVPTTTTPNENTSSWAVNDKLEDFLAAWRNGIQGTDNSPSLASNKIALIKLFRAMHQLHVGTMPALSNSKNFVENHRYQ
jgi:hypothetical protein